MRLVSLSEASAYEIKEKIPAFRGKITRINDPNSGIRDGEPWSMQNLELCDQDQPTIRLRIKLWNGEEIPKTWLHKIVMIESVEGQKGLKGVTMEQDTYNWQEGQPIKKQVEVQCGNGALFYLADSRAVDQPQNQAAPARQQAPHRPQTAAQTPARPEPAQRETAPQQQAPAKTAAEIVAEREAGYRSAIIGAGKFVGRKVSGFAVVLAAMDKLQEERQRQGKPITADQFQGMCTSIFIAGDRSFQWDKLPTTLEDLEKFWPVSRKAVNQSEPQQ